MCKGQSSSSKKQSVEEPSQEVNEAISIDEPHANEAPNVANKLIQILSS